MRKDFTDDELAHAIRENDLERFCRIYDLTPEDLLRREYPKSLNSMLGEIINRGQLKKVDFLLRQKGNPLRLIHFITPDCSYENDAPLQEVARAGAWGALDEILKRNGEKLLPEHCFIHNKNGLTPYSKAVFYSKTTGSFQGMMAIIGNQLTDLFLIGRGFSPLEYIFKEERESITDVLDHQYWQGPQRQVQRQNVIDYIKILEKDNLDLLDCFKAIEKGELKQWAKDKKLSLEFCLKTFSSGSKLSKLHDKDGLNVLCVAAENGQFRDVWEILRDQITNEHLCERKFNYHTVVHYAERSDSLDQLLDPQYWQGEERSQMRQSVWDYCVSIGCKGKLPKYSFDTQQRSSDTQHEASPDESLLKAFESAEEMARLGETREITAKDILNLKDHAGNRPLHRILGSYSPIDVSSIVEIVKRDGEELNVHHFVGSLAKNRKGSDPLHLAAEKKNIDWAMKALGGFGVLFTEGDFLKEKDLSGKCVMDIALKAHCLDQILQPHYWSQNGKRLKMMQNLWQYVENSYTAMGITIEKSAFEKAYSQAVRLNLQRKARAIGQPVFSTSPDSQQKREGRGI